MTNNEHVVGLVRYVSTPDWVGLPVGLLFMAMGIFIFTLGLMMFLAAMLYAK